MHEALLHLAILQATDQGFGNVKFTWNAPNDDYSTELGYVVRLGTTKGGVASYRTLKVI